MRVISEQEFSQALRAALQCRGVNEARAVTGPGRSGAAASAYASHIMGIPFLPFKAPCPSHLRPLLIVDTASKSGRTLRRAAKWYGEPVVTLAVFDEPPRVRFWYEVP